MIETIFAVQPFVLGRRGRILFGKLRDARDRAEAIAMAERLGAEVGAVAYAVTGDPALGVFDEPQILACVGSVPEDALMAIGGA